MSPAKIALLGAIAGLTIFLGLPLGRLSSPAPRARAWLNAIAAGILLFLLWDVLMLQAWWEANGIEPLPSTAVSRSRTHALLGAD